MTAIITYILNKKLKLRKPKNINVDYVFLEIFPELHQPKSIFNFERIDTFPKFDLKIDGKEIVNPYMLFITIKNKSNEMITNLTEFNSIKMKFGKDSKIIYGYIKNLSVSTYEVWKLNKVSNIEYNLDIKKLDCVGKIEIVFYISDENNSYQEEGDFNIDISIFSNSPNVEIKSSFFSDKV